MLGTKIKQHENNLYHLNSEKSKLDDSILHLQGTFVVPFKDFLSVWQVDEMVLPCSAILGYEKNSWIGCIGADNMICLDWLDRKSVV